VLKVRVGRKVSKEQPVFIDHQATSEVIDLTQLGDSVYVFVLENCHFTNREWEQFAETGVASYGCSMPTVSRSFIGRQEVSHSVKSQSQKTVPRLSLVAHDFPLFRDELLDVVCQAWSVSSGKKACKNNEQVSSGILSMLSVYFFNEILSKSLHCLIRMRDA
jgi:hypothetical protein